MTRFILAASLAAVASGALALGSASPSTSSGAPPGFRAVDGDTLLVGAAAPVERLR